MRALLVEVAHLFISAISILLLRLSIPPFTFIVLILKLSTFPSLFVFIVFVSKPKSALLSIFAFAM